MGKKITRQKDQDLKGGGEQSFQPKKKDYSQNPPSGKTQFLELNQFIIQILIFSKVNRSEDEMINRFREFTPDTIKVDIVQFVEKFAKTNVQLLKSLKEYLEKKMSQQTIFQNSKFQTFCKQFLKCINGYLCKKQNQGRSQFLNKNINSDRSPGYDQRLYEKMKQTQQRIQSQFVDPKYDLGQ